MTSHKKRVLVVDDEQHAIKLYITTLDEEFEVEAAMSVDEAIDIAAQGRISVVLIDIKMPKKDGFVLLSYMRENFPETPVILLSGYADKELAIRAVKLHAYDFLEKPCEPDEILIACRRAADSSMRSLGRPSSIARVMPPIASTSWINAQALRASSSVSAST